MVGKAFQLQISRLVDDDANTAGFALVDDVDAARAPVVNGLWLEFFRDGKVGMGGDDDSRVDRIEKGIAETRIVTVVTGDDNICCDIGVGGE